jgi:putative transposase
MSKVLKITEPDGFYFVTFTVVEWVDVFTRPQYKQIIIDSFKFCQHKKGLRIHAYVIMTNHIHCILSRKDNAPSLSDIIRDFKKFTAHQLLLAIQKPFESRRDWILPIFKKAGMNNPNNSNFQFWIQDNNPLEVHSLKFILQKIHYIHQNPVRAGFVFNAPEYPYSSAADYEGLLANSLINIDILDIYNTTGIL